MKYPCIKYEETRPATLRADNILYGKTNCYTVTIIDHNPDTTIRERLEQLPMCTFDRPYTSDNLYHFVYTLYF